MLPSGHHLTWPIWHRLPHEEKVRLARMENLTIGEFEESVQLFFALGEEEEEEEESPVAVPVPPQELPNEPPSVTSILDKYRGVFGDVAKAIEREESDDEGESSREPAATAATISLSSKAISDDLEVELFLPSEVIMGSMFPFLPIEQIMSSLPLLSKSWAWLATTHDNLYADFCRRRFPNLPQRPPRFRTSKDWLMKRPHPRPHGVYAIKESHIKKITR